MSVKLTREELQGAVDELHWIGPGVGEVFLSEDTALVLFNAACALLAVMEPASDDPSRGVASGVLAAESAGEGWRRGYREGYRAAEARARRLAGWEEDE